MSFWKERRVFVTGATGLLGAHLVRALVERDASVVALVRDEVPRSLFFSTLPEWRLRERVVTVRGDVESYPSLERTVSEYAIDTVFHLAAQPLVGTACDSPLATFRTNIQGTWNVLEAARVQEKHVRRVIVASSDKAYGEGRDAPYVESDALEARFPYDVSKSCGDLIARSYHATYRTPVVVARCANLFGPGDLNRERIVPSVFLDATAGRAPRLRSDGTAIREYLYVEDAVEAYLALGEAPEETVVGEAFNFGSGQVLSVLDVVAAILRSVGRTELVPVILDAAPREIRTQRLDASKAESRLRWRARHSFEEGIDKTRDWFRRGDVR